MLVKQIQQSSLYRSLTTATFNQDFFYKIGHCIFCCFLLPFTLYWFVKQQYLLAASELLMLVFFCVNLRHMVINKRELCPRSMVLICLGCQLLALTYYAGSSASLWAYPLLATYYFILPIKTANYTALAIMLPMGVILSISTESVFVIRYLSSITAALLITNLMVIMNNKLQQALTKQSITDPLTHCYNRRHMDTTLDQAIQLYRRSNHPASLLLIDIDYFKRINDEYGHLVGDDILREVVQVMTTSKRVSDMLFRYGGEEFVMLIPETNCQSAQFIAEKNRILLSAIKLPDQQRSITVSIGICEVSPNMDAVAWVQCADRALYQAKENGRNRVCSMHCPVAEYSSDNIIEKSNRASHEN